MDLVLQIAHARLLDDDTLDTCSGLSVATIMSLLSLCLNAAYFSYQGVFYKQVYGTAMGSPVSVVVANLVMEDIESRALSSFSPSPVFWKRYIDDVCCAVKEEDVIPFPHDLLITQTPRSVWLYHTSEACWRQSSVFC